MKTPLSEKLPLSFIYQNLKFQGNTTILFPQSFKNYLTEVLDDNIHMKPRQKAQSDLY